MKIEKKVKENTHDTEMKLSKELNNDDILGLYDDDLLKQETLKELYVDIISALYIEIVFIFVYVLG